MNIAIIEDCAEDASRLSDYIKAYCSDAQICQETSIFQSASDFFHVWKAGAFDLVFLDIFLEESREEAGTREELSGLRAARRIRSEDERCTIILCSFSPDFALAGYELRALDYLVKPVSYEALCKTMEYCLSRMQKGQRHYIEVKESRIMTKIRLDDILYTDYFNHYIQIHLSERIVRTYMRFSDFSPMLLCYPQFICCYRNCIINMDKVTSLLKTDFVLSSGERLPITRNLRPQVQQEYADYQFRKLNGGLG